MCQRHVAVTPHPAWRCVAHYVQRQLSQVFHATFKLGSCLMHRPQLSKWKLSPLLIRGWAGGNGDVKDWMWVTRGRAGQMCIIIPIMQIAVWTIQFVSFDHSVMLTLEWICCEQALPLMRDARDRPSGDRSCFRESHCCGPSLPRCKRRLVTDRQNRIVGMGKTF